MGIETELDFFSPYSISDSVSNESIDESFITQSVDDGENETVLPDAIQIISDDEQISENSDIGDNLPLVSVDLADSSTSDPGQAEEWSVQDPKPTQNPSDPEEPKNETVNTDNETLTSIYKLLDERIPEQKTGESETESEYESESESEVSLNDIKTILESIESYESEQLSTVSNINDNIINSINNDYHISMYEIGLLSAILGSLAINALFRKIL